MNNWAGKLSTAYYNDACTDSARIPFALTIFEGPSDRKNQTQAVRFTIQFLALLTWNRFALEFCNPRDVRHSALWMGIESTDKLHRKHADSRWE